MKRFKFLFFAALLSLSFFSSCTVNNGEKEESYIEKISSLSLCGISLSSQSEMYVDSGGGSDIITRDLYSYLYSFAEGRTSYDAYILSSLPMEKINIPSDRQSLKDKYSPSTSVFSGNYYFYRDETLYMSDYTLLDGLKTEWTIEDKIIEVSSPVSDGVSSRFGFSPHGISSLKASTLSAEFLRRTEKYLYTLSSLGYIYRTEGEDGFFLEADIRSFEKQLLSDFSSFISSLNTEETLSEAFQKDFFKKYLTFFTYGLSAEGFIDIMNGGKNYVVDSIFTANPFVNILLDYPVAKSGESAEQYISRLLEGVGSKTLGSLFLPYSLTTSEAMQSNIKSYFYTPLANWFSSMDFNYDEYSLRFYFSSDGALKSFSCYKEKNNDLGGIASTLGKYSLTAELLTSFPSLSDFSACEIVA